jgi:hypothetical protein
VLIHTRMLENTAQAQVTPQLICALSGPAPMHYSTPPLSAAAIETCGICHTGATNFYAMLRTPRLRRCTHALSATAPFAAASGYAPCAVLTFLCDAVRRQAEALGILGVNLIHSVLTKGGDHYAIVSSLMDDLSRARVEVPPTWLCIDKSHLFSTLQW